MNKKILKYFISFSIIFTLYQFIEVFYRMNTYWWSGLMAGTAAILIDRLNDEISWEMDYLLQGIIGAGIITALELIVGTLDRLFLHLYMWDYTNLAGNFYGIICPQFTFVWFIFSLILIPTVDALSYYVLRTSDIRPYYKIFGKVLLTMPERRNCNCTH